MFPLPAFHPHYDVLLVVFLLGFGYWYADNRIRPIAYPTAPAATPRQRWAWNGGLVALLVVSSWPFHDIGESALFTVHMVEHLVLALIVPGLLLVGTPRWLADGTLGHARIASALRPVARAVPAFFLFTISLVVIHWPLLVETMVSNALAHFSTHAWLMLVGLLMWLPVVSPTPQIPRLAPPGQMLYLLAHSLLPTIPASFLTFSSVPLYPVYGQAAREYGLTAVSDQTISGIVMKLGMGILLLITIAVIWFRWSNEEAESHELEASRST